MAFNKSKLNKIPQRNNDLVFGFVREEEKQWKNDQFIPTMIRYLCLLYFNSNKDAFVAENICEDTAFECKHNCITLSNAHLAGSAYLRNKVSQRKHIWRFKINKYNIGIAIEILNTKYKINDLFGYFDNALTI